MTSKLSIGIGPVTGEASIGGATDAVIGAKVKAWAVSEGIAESGDSNQEVANRVAAWCRDQLREIVKRWHIAEARTQFEQTSRAAGESYLDTEI